VIAGDGSFFSFLPVALVERRWPARYNPREVANPGRLATK